MAFTQIRYGTMPATARRHAVRADRAAIAAQPTVTMVEELVEAFDAARRR